jgi:alpha-D-ribose 1-methylphosphonate 5-triphosphate diphosphatase
MGFVLRSEKVLFSNGIKAADIIINDQYIEEIAPYGSSKSAINLKDFLIAPGIVDLHSDSIEKEIEPRPGAIFPEEMAILELDKKLSASGITTIFHAIGIVESFTKKNRSIEKSGHLIRLINEINSKHLSIDNKIHLRFETSSVSVLPQIKTIIEDGLVDMVSIMDHTPGQRQWKDIEKWKRFVASNITDEELQKHIDRKNMMKNKELLIEFMKFIKEKNIVTLSHDDDITDHIDENLEFGISISEFPLTVDIAHYAKEKGLAVGMGAPNIIRGSSQSGNVSAIELVREGICDYFCSDYHPSSMLKSVYKITEENLMSFEKAFEMVSLTPAKLSGLNDRGSIEKGKLADLIVIDESFSPKNVLTIKSGECVYSGIKGFLSSSEVK